MNVAARGAGLTMSQGLLGLGYRLMECIKSKSKREEVSEVWGWGRSQAPAGRTLRRSSERGWGV